MAKNADNQKQGLGQLNGALSLAILIASIALFYLDFWQLTTLFKVLILLAGVVVAAFVFTQSSQGERFIHFAKETRIELRKVVWPTREETLKTTGMIMVAVVIVAIFLWIVDAFFTWGVSSVSSLNIF
ncbi:MAG TPA: preprotein translocase subunit SecE [Candidatus Thioglobus sp.]|nr:preprotein translocase subunit SecE [Candidatus Thioglobus sp.]HIL21050.1 preprotein translocase subunit SecE [Candidatus Thioglobus sp.]